MAFFQDMGKRVWDYISPRKTQQRRDKPFKVPAVPIKTRALPKSALDMTPQTKLERWEIKTLSSAGSLDATLLPPSPPTSVSRHADLEGDTLVADSIEDILKNGTDDEDWDANEETLVVDDGKYMEEQKSIDPEKERMRREIQSRELREAGWTEDAVFLFQKLGMRGFEPLLPDHWVNDFDTLPVDMFTDNENKAFIKSNGGSDFRGMYPHPQPLLLMFSYTKLFPAQHALEELFALGGVARDAVLTNAPIRTPEFHIRKAVQKYDEWAMKDGEMDHVWNDLSLFEIVTSDKNTHSSVAERKMLHKLSKLYELWSEAFKIYDGENRSESDYVAAPEELPTLYGVIASYTIMAFVSYVPPSEVNAKASLRTIAIFDFSEEGYDVWNSFAVAIFIIHCRNRMKQLEEFLPEPEVRYPRDPDV